MQAVMDRNRREIRALVEVNHADINAKSTLPGNFENWLPLHYALYTGYAEEVELLMELGAEVNVPGAGQNIALHFAAYSTRHDTRIMTKLLEYAGSKELIAWTNSRGQTPLFVAVDSGNLPVVQALIAANSDVSSASAGGDRDTPLIAAIRKGYVGVAQALLATDSIDLEVFNRGGHTALHVAAHMCWLDMCQQLLERGAVVDSHVVTEDGKVQETPMLRVFDLYWKDKKVAGVPASEPLAMVEFFVRSGASVNHSAELRGTPLSGALLLPCTQRNAVIRFLLEQPGIKVTDLGYTSNRLLSWAVKVDHFSLATRLLENGVNADITHLSTAVESCRPDMVTFLVGRGVGVTEKVSPKYGIKQNTVRYTTDLLSLLAYVVGFIVMRLDSGPDAWLEVVFRLLDAGASWDKKTDPNSVENYLRLARSGRVDAQKTFDAIQIKWEQRQGDWLLAVKAGTQEDAWPQSLSRNHAPAVQWLLENKQDKLTDQEIRFGLKWAIKYGQKDLENKLMLLQMKRIEQPVVLEMTAMGSGGGAVASASPQTSTLVCENGAGGGCGPKDHNVNDERLKL
jgi:ankyrin repeat protein